MKSSRKLRLTDEARADVRDIRRYTSRRWGPEQRDRYPTTLRQAMRGLLDYPERGRARDEFYPGCRSLPVEQHVIFYRVLHADQDAADIVDQRT